MDRSSVVISGGGSKLTAVGKIGPFSVARIKSWVRIHDDQTGRDCGLTAEYADGEERFTSILSVKAMEPFPDFVRSGGVFA